MHKPNKSKKAYGPRAIRPEQSRKQVSGKGPRARPNSPKAPNPFSAKASQPPLPSAYIVSKKVEGVPQSNDLVHILSSVLAYALADSSASREAQRKEKEEATRVVIKALVGLLRSVVVSPCA
ncbi:hypothetical protein LIER_25566 [Lithospermum erythrorhizon]|uniref:Uncharacterized protein n=1 Tax=Lithospermum erythrorhizon TaxID=34254 RepID=A0AAV3RB39_LITER